MLRRRATRLAIGALLLQCLAAGGTHAECPTTARTRAPGTDYDEVTVLGIRSGVLDDDASAFSTRIEVDDIQGSPRSLADVCPLQNYLQPPQAMRKRQEQNHRLY